MTVAYFDCFSGIAGDMILGALIDLGVDNNYFNSEIKKLKLSNYIIDIKKVEKNGYFATDVNIVVNKDLQPHRTLKDINKLIDKSSLNSDVKDLSKKIFYNLAVAEGKVHNAKVENVHFHEVGAIDSIIDIVGSVICLKNLGINKIYSSSLPLGNGFTVCEHGKIPLPAPATVELVKNIPTYNSEAKHEMVTPTGAAFISTLSEDFGEKPSMKNQKTGYGTGKIKSDEPGLLRVITGKLEQIKTC